MAGTAIDWSLYAIIDKAYLGERSVRKVTEALIAGGAGIIQLRNKTYHSDELYEDALAVIELTRSSNVPLIINDRVDIALAVHADGVHLGQDDLPLDIARRLLGPTKLMGASVHSMAEFEKSKVGNPDYYGVGTIYGSGTKSELPKKGVEIIQRIRRETTLPLIAIGGITPDKLAAVFQAGADGVAAISALLSTGDVQARAAEFVSGIKKYRKAFIKTT